LGPREENENRQFTSLRLVGQDQALVDRYSTLKREREKKKKVATCLTKRDTMNEH
jgi:hypothetical protein